jgi:hypothetical protein
VNWSHVKASENKCQFFERKDSGHAVRKDGFLAFAASAGISTIGAVADQPLLCSTQSDRMTANGWGAE